jgi:hypothetical protein
MRLKEDEEGGDRGRRWRKEVVVGGVGKCLMCEAPKLDPL